MKHHNIAAIILAKARQYPERPAFLTPDRVLTYGELVRRVEVMASHLAGMPSFSQVESPRVGVFCPGGIDHAVIMLALMRAGACAVPVAGELPEFERNTLHRVVAPHGVIVGGGAVWPGLSGLTFDLGEGTTWYAGETRPTSFPENEFALLGPAFVRFSSGTTGQSKGVVLSHQTLGERLDSANRRLEITGNDRVLWTLPMAHHFVVSILLYLRSGAGIILAESSLASDMLEAALSHEATVFYGSPFQSALLAAETSKRPWPALRLAVSTAAPLSRPVTQAFQLRYGQPLVQALGIIEMGLPFLNLKHAANKPLAVGAPDDFEVKLAGGGEEGELLLRGPGMFDAYLVPWRRRSEVMQGGWFATGDLARRDPDGTIHLVGRLKSVINVGGSKCFPEEIENILQTHPEVVEVRVYGMSHPHWGELPVAQVVAQNPKDPPAAAELIAFCRQRLASYKIPVRFEWEVVLPRTASGKMVRA